MKLIPELQLKIRQSLVEQKDLNSEVGFLVFKDKQLA